MRERRDPGMDHGFYGFSPMPSRPTLHWPNGARIAFWILLHFEYWELDPPTAAYRDPRLDGELGSIFPDYRNYSQREYGHRVGIFRVLEVLDRYRLKATVAANAAACERYPYLVEGFRRRGWEFAAHGTHATRMITSRMTEAEERAVIAESVAAVERATGDRPNRLARSGLRRIDTHPASFGERGARLCHGLAERRPTLPHDGRSTVCRHPDPPRMGRRSDVVATPGADAALPALDR